jgi:hypothetical protein
LNIDSIKRLTGRVSIIEKKNFRVLASNCQWQEPS